MLFILRIKEKKMIDIQRFGRRKFIKLNFDKIIHIKVYLAKLHDINLKC